MTDAVGLRTTLRIRFGSHDVHYAGELIDGARILALFGDVATELLIRLDGDEGLFRAYESVEFLAPVRAGDIVEATGLVTRVGRTSRQMTFEARTVACNVRDGRNAPSAADVLPEPLLVCRAVGTCVVPAPLQRKPVAAVPAPPATAKSAMLPSEVILTAAIVGAEVTREQTPYLPITPDEIAAEAVRCADAGAAIVHVHVRNADGSPSQSPELYRAAIDAIRARTNIVVQVSTGGAVGMSIEQRCGSLVGAPEMATLNCGSVNFGDDVFINTRPQIRDLARRIVAAGSVPELECYDLSHLDEVVALHREGLLTAPLHVQFVLGVPGGAGAREDVLRFLLSQLPTGALWGCAAIGRHQQPMTELALRLGGNVRVGLEDNLYLQKGVLAPGSAPLVERAAKYARSLGRQPVDGPRARALLSIP